MSGNSLAQLEKDMLANLVGLFFISGFSALIYQVCWQRLLFTSFGIDLTSITIIISIFMLGLGIGAFFGGRIADRYPQKIILVFCAIEFLIGMFGFISYYAIYTLQELMVQSSLFMLTFWIFALLIIPTFMMGSTLPLLTTFFNTYIGNIGESIGSLYFYNTLGAALGALATGFILFNYLTISQTLMIAVCLNIFIAMIIFILYGRKKYE
ncbi:fused MFS/spermidine synthase [Acinetobacter johnsonii]|uniref:fused MFS/spermidine synthase n=1 Tax=Acinetobacter johnsonii TaxID=40214 RepID=UPI001F413240|nr:fused MFS/spermidine synthase [Acinetobacter johnsonii]